MKTLSTLVVPVTLLALFLAAGCSDEASLTESSTLEFADVQSNDKGGSPRVTVPFKASWATTLGPPTFPGDCDNLDPVPNIFGILGEGKATHLGRTQLRAISSVDDVPEPEPDVQKTCTIYIAANGDQLYAETIGIATVEGPFVSFSGDTFFTGGTGRFRDASGSAKYAGTFNFITNTGQFTEDGTLELQRGRGHRNGGFSAGR